MHEGKGKDSLVSFQYRVPISEIAYVRFILEGYEGLAVQSSEKSNGRITWETTVCQVNEAHALARALAVEMGLKTVSPP
jgi:hypothetical protein